jgi:hypothetical protein
LPHTQPPLPTPLSHSPRLVPEGRGHYWPFFTLAFISVLLVEFFFMAGQYQVFIVAQGHKGSKEW